MSGCDKLVDAGRRAFFARTAAVAAGAAATAAIPVAARAAPSLALVNYPSSKLGNVRDLKVDAPQDIAYPDADSPGVLLKLGSRVEGGAGPDGDIVAFSTLCPHKGFPLNYGSSTRPSAAPAITAASMSRRAACRSSATPPRTCRSSAWWWIEQGDIYAVAVDELIYGRLSNVLTAEEGTPWPTSATSTGCRSRRRTPRFTTSSATTASSVAAITPCPGQWIAKAACSRTRTRSTQDLTKQQRPWRLHGSARRCTTSSSRTGGTCISSSCPTTTAW